MLSPYRGNSNAPTGADSNKPIYVTLAGIYPPNPDGTAQTTNQIFIGSGAPDDADGANGDIYFRTDGTITAGTVLYHKEGGSWTNT